MKIIIVGCGTIGSTILQSLLIDKHDITVIERDGDTVNQVNAMYDVMAIQGSGIRPEVLKSAGAASADMVIACTDSDEMNLLCCFTAKQLGTKRTVARVRDWSNDDLQFMRDRIGLSLSFNPELLTAQAIYNLIKLPAATKVQSFSGRGFELVELTLRADFPAEGRSLIELRKHHKEKFLVCTVMRNDELMIPRGDFVLHAGDKITVISAVRDTHHLPEIFSIAKHQAKNIMIAGATRTATKLATLLSTTKHSVRIIDDDPETCSHISDLLDDKIDVVCGDPMNQELLLEEGIEAMDAIVAMTADDRTDILLSLYAITQKVPKVVCCCEHDELGLLAEHVGMDSIVSSRQITADVLLKYTRALRDEEGSRIETLYSLQNGHAEAVEFSVLADFDYLNIPLKTLKMKKGAILAGITRGKDIIVPSGDDVIMENDRVIVIVTGSNPLDLVSVFER